MGATKAGAVYFRIFAAAVAMWIVLSAALPASAQQTTGTILGVVRDRSGAVIPEAAITITNIETGLSRTVMTGADGSFRAPALAVGRYDLRIEKAGFRAETQHGLILEVAQELVVNSALEVGAVSQEVEISAEAPLVNTTSSALGSMVNEQRMSDLPLNGRNYVDLTLMQPGVAQQTTASGGGAGISGTWFSANGAPVRSNNYTLDGALLVNAYGASTSSESGTTLGVDGIREYKVVTSAFSAEYGVAMGSQMVIVSKSGTNQWHGDVFEYLRNSALDARNFYDTGATSGGRRLPAFRRNNFGGSFGGPIRKDKAFFYAVYEGLRQNVGVTILDNDIPAACHQLVNPNSNNTTLANPGACAPGLTSSTVIPPVVQPFLALYPIPNLSNNQYTFPTSSTQRVDYGQMRVDQNFSSADTFFGRYTADDGDLNNATLSTSPTPSGAAFPQFRILGSSRNQFVTLSENHIFSAALLNTARISFSRTNFAAFNSYSQNLAGPQYSFVPGLPMGSIAISSGITTLGPNTGYPTVHIQNIYNFSDDLFYAKGRHALKFGVLFNRYNSGTWHTKLTQGSMTFASLANFMQGIYQSYTSLTPGSSLGRYFIYNTMGTYVQDDIRVTSRLTVNAGLRYEFMTTPWELNNKQSRFLDFTDPAQTWTYGQVMRNPTLKNFSPRVGFAWDVRGNGKTAVRAGFGLYQDVGNIGSALEQQPNAMPPYSSQSSVSSNPTNKVIPVPLAYGPADLGTGLQTMGYNVQQPHALEYNLTVEQQVPFGVGVAVSYVGFRGRDLWLTKEANPEVPAIVNGAEAWYPFLCGGAPSAVTCTGAVANPAYRRVNPAWGTVIMTTTGSKSWYDSLQVVLNKRLSHGLQFQSGYTWSKGLDTTQGQMYASDCAASGGLQGTDPLNPQNDKGPSCFDVRHNWHMNLLYHVPDINSGRFAAKLLHGWWVGNIVTAQSGFGFTPLLSVNRSNSGVLNGQADRVVLGTDTVAGTGKAAGLSFVPYNAGSVITGDPNGWFNPLMFRLGTAGFLGNASRNMLRGPGLAMWNVSINKDTAVKFLGEGGKLQFRAEIFNILNRANFTLPPGASFTGTLTDPAGATEPPVSNVGKITSTSTTSRQIQLALKVIF